MIYTSSYNLAGENIVRIKKVQIPCGVIFIKEMLPGVMIFSFGYQGLGCLYVPAV